MTPPPHFSKSFIPGRKKNFDKNFSETNFFSGPFQFVFVHILVFLLVLVIDILLLFHSTKMIIVNVNNFPCLFQQYIEFFFF